MDFLWASVSTAFKLTICLVASSHWFFNLTDKPRLKEQIGIIELLSRYLGIYMIIYFVFRKASKPLKNKKVWINWRIRPAFFISFVSNLIIIIFLEIKISQFGDKNLSDQERNLALSSLSCTSYVWITSASFEYMSVLIFCLFVNQLEKHTEE